MLFNVKQRLKNPLVSSVVTGVLLILILGFFFITENFLILLVLIVPLVILSLINDYRILLFLLFFSLPLSTSIRIGELNLNIGLPSEPLIGLLTIITLIFIFLQDRQSGILRHPLSILVLFYWITLVTSGIFSCMPLVSAKTLLVTTCYLLVFYYLIAYYLVTNDWKIKNIFFLYAYSLFGIVVYTTIKHSDYSFNKLYSAFIVEPFFSDHTIYGVCLAFMLPIMGVMYFKASKLELRYFEKIIAGLFLLTFLTGVYLSHSRATWVSLASILGVLLILRLKISFYSLMAIAGIILLVILLNLDVLMPVLIKNKYDSKAKRANLEEQIRSVTNIKNDVSNAERVNRWLCAVRMFKEKPLTGFGIGTYQFKYIPFQKGSETTEISVTSAKNNFTQGVGGTAHSEYLLALSESGLFSLVGLILLFLYAIYLSMKLYYTGPEDIKYYALMMLLSLFTYFVHAIFNNFLTTDKAAFLVWGSLAVLCALDLKQKQHLLSNSIKNL
jgi:putative inorganic carbon (HCO3(-)) transporter